MLCICIACARLADAAIALHLFLITVFLICGSQLRCSWCRAQGARTMPRTLCATPGCPGDAADRCLRAAGDKRCGNCCDCGGHNRRSRRAGPGSGGRSATARAHREHMQSAFGVLQEACSWLTAKCVGELEAYNLRTPTAIRRAVYRAVRMKLLREKSHTAEPGVELLELLPFLMQERVMFGSTPDIMRGVHESQLPADRSGVPASSSGIIDAVPAPPQPPDAAHPERRVRPRGTVLISLDTPAQARRSRSPTSSPTSELRVAPSAGLALQLRWDELSESVIQEAVRCALAFQLKAPPGTAVPASLQLQRGGTFLWSTLAGRPSHPACRDHGDYPVTQLQQGNRQSFWQWQENGGCFGLHDRELGAATFSDSLHHFIAGRPHLRSRVRSLTRARPAWEKHVIPGTWLYADVEGAANYASRLQGYHGTSMHMLERIMAQGLETGWNGVVRRNIRRLGVYFHILPRAHLCHNYMLYSALDDTGFLISAVIHLSAPAWDPLGRMTSIATSNQPQNLTYPDVCHVHGIYFHIVHVLQLWHGASDSWLWAEPRYAQQLEVDPLLERAVLESNARERAGLQS